MLGFTSSGCFIMGIILGFILALFVGIACVFYFNPEFKEKSISNVESLWGSVKDGVDNSIDAVKKAPVAEPAVPKAAVPKAPVKAQPAEPQLAKPQASMPKTEEPQKKRREIELPVKGVKVSW